MIVVRLISIFHGRDADAWRARIPAACSVALALMVQSAQTQAQTLEKPASDVTGAQTPKTSENANSSAAAAPVAGEDMTMAQFLDRLMMAESGGRLLVRNPRSTALGPFQFIASTWLMIANKHFAKETEGLSAGQILALRIDKDLARRAAEIYTNQNAAYLVAQGHKATFTNLRLAFLVGPSAAVRILSSPGEAPLSTLLGPNVMTANPFMARLTAEGLVARAAREVAAKAGSTAGVTPDAAAIAEAQKSGATTGAQRTRITVPCSLSLPSCRRWLALSQKRQGKAKQRRASN